MIGLKFLVRGYLENTLCNTTLPFKNSENSVMTQALIYLSCLFVCFSYKNAFLNKFCWENFNFFGNTESFRPKLITLNSFSA